MMRETWSVLRHLTPEMAWGDPLEMNAQLITALDRLWDDLGAFHIDCGTQGAHLADSEHALGNAVDLIFLNPIGFTNSLLAITRYPAFTGIGYYPKWSLNGVVKGGWHLDCRSPKDGRGARWMGLPDPNKPGSNVYGPLSVASLLAQGVVL